MTIFSDTILPSWFLVNAVKLKKKMVGCDFLKKHVTDASFLVSYWWAGAGGNADETKRPMLKRPKWVSKQLAFCSTFLVLRITSQTPISTEIQTLLSG